MQIISPFLHQELDHTTVGDWQNVFVFVYLCNSVCVFANHTSETGADLRAKVLLSQVFSRSLLSSSH